MQYNSFPSLTSLSFLLSLSLSAPFDSQSLHGWTAATADTSQQQKCRLSGKWNPYNSAYYDTHTHSLSFLLHKLVEDGGVSTSRCHAEFQKSQIPRSKVSEIKARLSLQSISPLSSLSLVLKNLTRIFRVANRTSLYKDQMVNILNICTSSIAVVIGKQKRKK